MTTRSRRRFGSPWPLLFAIASLGQPLVAAEALKADVPKLVPGVELPLLEAKALSGDEAALPRDARGHAAVLVIGFSKAAAKVSQGWLESCRSAAVARSAEPGIDCYDVRMLEDVPRFFRGSMEHGMRSGFPDDLQRHTLLAYTENAAWRARVGVADEKTAYVVGCDREGLVRATAAGGFAEAEMKKILEAIVTVSDSAP
ncbi:MAG TPA: hypothetical protein VFB49_00345 [Patescibacteria group bacterium]|nr:hypothetical protein [Patescibacteria group bacterium]